MKIDRNNYEVYLIDYMDGNLSPNQVADLLLFLEENPDIKEEFDSIDLVELPDDKKLPVDFKNSLKMPVETKQSITKENYEEYFIASIEGDLSKPEQKQLVDFLLRNPELSKEFKLFEQTVLSVDSEIRFENKDLLKRKDVVQYNSITATNYEEYFIAHYENDLSLEERNNLKQFLDKNPELQSEFDLFGKTYLVADEKVVFEEKRSLKKFALPVTRKLVYYVTSAAASIILIAALFGMFGNGETPTVRTIAKRDNVQFKLNRNTQENTTSGNSNFASSKTNKVNQTKTIKQVQQERIISAPIAFINPKKININTKPERINEFKTDHYDLLYYYSLKNDQAIADAEPQQKTKDDNVYTIEEFGVKRFKEISGIGDPNEKQISLWDFADAGVSGLNKITRSKMKLDREEDPDGNTVAIAFESKLLSFSRPVK